MLGISAMAQPQFEIYKDQAGKFRWRLRAANGEVIASSEAYEVKAGCEKGIAAVKKDAPIAVLQDLTK
jgi:uncharacterized protein YegP (UPF0339 family)